MRSIWICIPTRPPISRSCRAGWRRFDQTFVTVLDEGVIEESVAVLGHRGDDLFQGWEAVGCRWRHRHAGRTEDAEACDFHGDHLYVSARTSAPRTGRWRPAGVGRAGPEADLPAAVAGKRPPIEIARNRFGLHRAVNDRLRESGLGPARTRAAGARAAHPAHDRSGARRSGRRGPAGCARTISRSTSRACASSSDGTLLLGLRYPVTAEGEPMLVELLDLEAFFADPDSCRRPRRGLDPRRARAARRTRSASARCTGPPTTGSTPSSASLDALGKDSGLVADHPAAARRTASTGRCGARATAAAASSNGVKIHSFPGERSVEGLAKMPSGPFLYVIDRDHNVHLRFLLAEDE